MCLSVVILNNILKTFCHQSNCFLAVQTSFYVAYNITWQNIFSNYLASFIKKKKKKKKTGCDKRNKIENK